MLIVGVMAAVFEEIFFRGLLQRAFLKRGLHPVLAIGITSVFFGATHFQLLQLPGLVVAGAVFGTLAYRADRLGPAIAAHLTFNMVTVIAPAGRLTRCGRTRGATMTGAMSSDDPTTPDGDVLVDERPVDRRPLDDDDVGLGAARRRRRRQLAARGSRVARASAIGSCGARSTGSWSPAACCSRS